MITQADRKQCFELAQAINNMTYEGKKDLITNAAYIDFSSYSSMGYHSAVITLVHGNPTITIDTARAAVVIQRGNAAHIEPLDTFAPLAIDDICEALHDEDAAAFNAEMERDGAA